jgi:hypothetical protein
MVIGDVVKFELWRVDGKMRPRWDASEGWERFDAARCGGKFFCVTVATVTGITVPDVTEDAVISAAEADATEIAVATSVAGNEYRFIMCERWYGHLGYPRVTQRAPSVCTCGGQFVGGSHSHWCDAAEV